MIINNIVLEKKHLYMQLLLNAEAIKKQEELNSIKKENDMEEYSDINDIWIKSFIGLIREGLKYDCIQMSDGNKIIRLTIDNIQFDCGIDKLQEELGSLYNQTINDTVNITYMDNIASVIAKSQDAYQLLYQRIGEDEAVKEGHRKRLLEQFSTILKGRDDICNIGIVQKDGVMLINSGYQATNPDLDLSTQEWYTNAVDKYNQY